MPSSANTVILGIDPGLANTGYGVIRRKKKSLELVGYGCITTGTKDLFAERLSVIVADLNSLIKKYRPDIAAIEEIFFAKNVKTALKVGQAKGAVIAACSMRGIRVKELTPLQIKQSMTGYGRADKNQVQQMVKNELGMSSVPRPDHAADALAAAVCCAHLLDSRLT